MPDPVAPVALSMGEAAAAASISRAKLYELLAAGAGPPTVTIGTRRVVRRVALEAWLQDLEAQQAQAAEAGR